ncbi:hypothetical protein [Cecembia lonarensis]|uniref:Uncharacterized protein n=1 Tax=Cecembia lonarensis (strain CCUG 58316 / KCTC 22772 / LW9) TaxID=1225176 RepID=K1L3V1_CECL9|nr:hypothetical protein [Cecembia lonarensis]EKB51125.1 hypothetical protein B879_00176 [Cecembia lonarensis LW9]
MHISKIKNALKDLNKIAELSLEHGAIAHLTDTIFKIENEISSAKLKLDILFLGNEKMLNKVIPENLLGDWQQKEFLQWNDGKYIIRVFGPKNFPLVKIDELQPVIKIIIWDNIELDQEDFNYMIERFTKNTAFIYFFSNLSKDKMSFEGQQLIHAWKMKLNALDEFLGPVEFCNSLPEQAKKAFIFISAVFAIRKISEFLEIQMINEQKDLDAKKISVTKELETHKKSANSKTGQEIYSHIKTNLSKSASEFEKGIGERFGKITKVQDNSLFYKIEKEIDELKALSEKEVDGEMILKLPSSVDQLLGWIKEELKDHLTNDVISLNDFLSASVEEVEEQLEKAGLSNAKIPFEVFDKNKIDPLLVHNIRLEKDFEAKGVSKNFNTIFSAIRQPVFMVMSIFMIAGFAGFNQEIQFIKDNFSILIVILLGFGTYQAFHNIAKEKRRKMSEETKKAKQFLLTELKKILSNIEREWKQPYTDFLKKQIRDVIDSCETELKNMSQKQAQESHDKNLLTQRKMLTINNQEKQFQSGLREKQNFDNKLKSLITDTKLEFNNLAK